MTKAYAIYDPDGNIEFGTITDSQESTWIEFSIILERYDDFCTFFAECKEKGYKCLPIQIADKDSVVISKDEYEELICYKAMQFPD